MTSWSALAQSNAPVRVALLTFSDSSLDLAGLLAPLQALQQRVGCARCSVTVYRLDHSSDDAPELAEVDGSVQLALLVGTLSRGSGAPSMPAGELSGSDRSVRHIRRIRELVQICQRARFWGAVGEAVLDLACLGHLGRQRSALPWSLYDQINEVAEQAVLLPNLFELDERCLTCCGGAASLDLALTLVQLWFGAEQQGAIMNTLCVDQVRAANQRQQSAMQIRDGVLPPSLREAIALMESHIEETLSTDDIAHLVNISRRQLERQFKQYLGNMPARYYLELRLNRARQMLLESHSSIVQIGLMCGFSSGAHFSTAFSAQFGITPRAERQRKMNAVLPAD